MYNFKINIKCFNYVCIVSGDTLLTKTELLETAGGATPQLKTKYFSHKLK